MNNKPPMTLVFGTTQEDPEPLSPDTPVDRGDTIPDDDLIVEDPPETEPAAEAPPEPTPEPEPAPEAQPEPEPAPKKEPKIPKSRFDEVIAQRKERDERIKVLEAQIEASKRPFDFDFDSKEEAYTDAVLDGNKELAKTLRREIRGAEQAMAQNSARVIATETADANDAQAQFTAVVAKVEAAYPELNPKSEHFDKELVTEVIELHAGFVARGYSDAAAMTKASAYVAKMYDLEGPPPAPAAKPAPKAPSTVAQKLAAATKQPPTQSGVSGSSTDSQDYANLTDAEWDALPKSTRAKLRGDMV